MKAPPGHILYFAYGSNLCVPRLRARTPSCRVLGRGTLPGYRLSFHKIGRDGSAKCDAFFTGEGVDLVEGAIFSLLREERSALDEAEDLGRGYIDRQVEVETSRGCVNAITYCALPDMIDPGLEPFDWYKAFVLAGARHHELTPGYIERLEAISSRPDRDAVRVAENMRILGA